MHLVALLLAVSTVRASPAAERPDCALGFLAWCAIDAPATPDAPPLRFRVELFGGYKPDFGYFARERGACEAKGCRLSLDGPLVMVDAFVPVSGRPRGDDAFDLGLSFSMTPVVRGLENNPGFEGELGPVAAGDGALSMATLRASLRRASLFGLIRSKYLVTTFGVGVALPVASGAGRTFPGGDGARFTLGGKVGLQVPLTPGFALGAGTVYGVVWYGPRFETVAYIGGVGLFGQFSY